MLTFADEDFRISLESEIILPLAIDKALAKVCHSNSSNNQYSRVPNSGTRYNYQDNRIAHTTDTVEFARRLTRQTLERLSFFKTEVRLKTEKDTVGYILKF